MTAGREATCGECGGDGLVRVITQEPPDDDERQCRSCAGSGRETTPPNDRGCVFCQAQPGEWCVADCGGPAPVIHPDNVWTEGDDD